jgi:hypothetical protein
MAVNFLALQSATNPTFTVSTLNNSTSVSLSAPHIYAPTPTLLSNTTDVATTAYVNQAVNGSTAYTASATPIQMTVTSTPNIIINGTLAQSVYLPNATLLPVGAVYNLNNNSSATVSIYNYAGGSLLYSALPGAHIKGILLSNGTNIGLWDVYIFLGGGISYSDSAGTLNPTLTTSVASSALSLNGTAGVNLQYGGATKLATTSTGVTVTGAISATSITGPLATTSTLGVVQVGSGLTVSSGTITMPYFVWHFNWNAVQNSSGIVGSTGLTNSINNTNISGTYINTSSSGQLTIPISGVYICTFDCAASSGPFNTAILRINGTNYNPYETGYAAYIQVTVTEILYLTAGQIIDWYCANGAFQTCTYLASGTGSGKGINFALLH